MKQYLWLLLLLPLLVHGESMSAIPGKQYPHTTGEFQVQLNTGKKLSIYSKYNWSICNEPLFYKEMKNHDRFFLKTLIEAWLKGTARHIVAYINTIETVFTEPTNKELMGQLSSSINPMGICVDNLKIDAYNR